MAYPATGRSAVEVLPTAGRFIWRLASAELDGGPGAREIVGGGYDGRVTAFAAGGQILWDAPTSGFIHQVSAGDLDGDGRDEIVAASADGFLYVFASNGTLLWKRDLKAPVLQATIARLDGGPPVVVATAASRILTLFTPAGEPIREIDTGAYPVIVRSGKFAAASGNSLLLLGLRLSPPWTPYVVRLFGGRELTPLLEIERAPEVLTPRGHGMDCTVADLGGDGLAELVTPHGAISLLPAPAWKTKFAQTQFPSVSYDFHYRMGLVATGDLTSNAGPETVVLYGPDIALHDATGRVLGTVRAPQGFTAAAFEPAKGTGALLLSGSPAGDDNLYRVTFEPGWERSLASLPLHGLPAQIAHRTEELSRQIAGWSGTPARGAAGPYPIVVEEQVLDTPARLAALGRAIAEVKAMRQDFPYSNLRFAAILAMRENSSLLRPDGQPWPRDPGRSGGLTREQLVGAARRLEQEGVPFWVRLGHSAGPWIELATVAAILEAAPGTCLGFLAAEDERPEPTRDFLEHFVRPAMELCLKHGGRSFMLDEKNAWWAATAATPEVRRLLFDGRYRSVLVPSVEDSNSRSPDLNLAGRVGLWLSGRVDRWSCRLGSDWFSFNRSIDQEYLMAGHAHLRYLVTQVSLGASAFTIAVGHRNRDGSYSRVGREGLAPFLHLLGKGVIAPPAREQLASLSPVALEISHPTSRYLASAANGHGLARYADTDLEPWAFGRLDSYWGMAPTPPADLSAVLWGRRRQFLNSSPASEFGFVAVLPAGVPTADRSPWTNVWTTDGDHVTRDGQPLGPEAARASIRRDLEAGAGRFPFRIRGEVFWQVAAHGNGGYLITLVDPGSLDPGERRVELVPQSGRWRIRDRISGVELGPLGERMPVLVPAGAFRLLEAAPTR